MVSTHEGFFHNITEKFGIDYTRLLKSWINTKKRMGICVQQRIFLLRCRRSDVLPPHIKYLKSNTRFHNYKTAHEFEISKSRYQRAILNLEISDVHEHLNILRVKIKEIESELLLCLPESILNMFFNTNKEKIFKHIESVRVKLVNKFRLIIDRQDTCRAFSNINNTKWLVNTTNKQIPDSIKNFLSLGDNFALPVSRTCKEDRCNYVLETIKNVEFNSYKFPPNAINEIRGTIANSLQLFLNRNKHVCHIDRYILNEFSKTKKFLRENDDVFVTKADKGQITVIMDKSDYINRMTEVLNDTTTYKKVNKNPIKQITTKLNQLVKSWYDNGIVEYQDFKRLYCTNGNLPRCYGLPKIHKIGFPMRIIVSAIGSPLYNIANYIHTLLHNSIPKPRSHVKDGWSFAKIIKNTTITSDHVLVSLDVTALFTNIPNELVYEAVRRRWHYISEHTELDLSQFLHAIELILHSTSFCFDGQFYEQIHGSPMGSPLSPILADMVMEDLETHCLSLLDFDIPIFLRYVDDVFTVVPRSSIDALLHAFDGYHPRLQFTYEIETDDSLPFLDTIVIRDGDTLITNWHRKPTFSGRYINYFSNHPLKYKINSINNLVDHAILLSDMRFHHDNVNIVYDILTNNSFPRKLIHKHIKNRLRQIKNRIDIDTNNTERDNLFDARRCVAIPYVKGLSGGIRGTLERVGLDVVYKIPKKLSAVVRRGKDRLTTEKETNVVYKIDCESCDASYIGQTKRHLETRVKEHFSDIKKHDSNFSVVSKHRIQNDHNFKWSDPTILHKERNLKMREIAEMFFIKKYNNTINLKKDTENLNAVYDRVIASV